MRHTLTLDEISEGSKVVVKEINTGRGLKHRLYSMGLLPGNTVEVVVNKHHGPLVIRVMETEISVGRGIAGKIIVEVINQ